MSLLIKTLFQWNEVLLMIHSMARIYRTSKTVESFDWKVFSNEFCGLDGKTLSLFESIFVSNEDKQNHEKVIKATSEMKISEEY